MYEHDHHSHDRDAAPAFSRALWLTGGFALVEAAVGWWSGSLALISDAGHMITDASALGFAALAAHIARRPSNPRHSWGMGRAEVIAALVNAAFMLVLVGGILVGAVQRLRTPVPVAGGTVMIVAAFGLLLNLLVLKTLGHGHSHSHDHTHAHDHPSHEPENLNLRGARLHVLGDLFGSVAALASGAVIYFTGWIPIDPILSFLICGLIVLSAIRLLKDGLHVVMEGVPRHLDLQAVGAAMAKVPGVMGVHDLHIWQVNSERIALSAHIVLRKLDGWPPVLAALNALLREHYRIDHATLQPEPVAAEPLPMPGSKAAKAAP